MGTVSKIAKQMICLLRGNIFRNIIKNMTNTRRITQVIPIDTEDGRLSVALVLIRKNNDVFR